MYCTIGIKSAPLIKSNDEIPKEVVGSPAAPISNWIVLRWAISRPASRPLSDITNLESRRARKRERERKSDKRRSIE